MKEFLRLVIALTLIAAVSGVILAAVESVTREPIAEQRRLQMLRALSAVLPEFDNHPDADTITITTGTDRQGRPVDTTFYRGRKDQQLTGTAFQVVAPDGYSGNIAVMVGVRPDHSVHAIEILTHAETPGLGDKISEPWYKALFTNKTLENSDWRVKKDGGDFDQLTGATISARAVVGAVRTGLELYREHEEKISAHGGDQ
ncbi:MAG: RnfABCDGE type electron transport complex subunit G [Pelovirga sp.]